MGALSSLQLAIMAWYLSFGVGPGLVLAVFEIKESGMMKAGSASYQNIPCNVDGKTTVGKIESPLLSGPNSVDEKESLKAFIDSEDLVTNSELEKITVGLRHIKTGNKPNVNHGYASSHNHHKNLKNLFGFLSQRDGRRQYPPSRYKFLNSSVKCVVRRRESQDLSGKARYFVRKLSGVLFEKEANPNVPNSIQYTNDQKLTSYEAHARLNKRIKRQNTFKASNNENATSSIPDSCKGRCGKETFLPCSCSKRCVVYKNCCEGFTEDCPSTANDGKMEYTDFLEAQVVCTDSNILVITSCRKDNSLLNSSFLKSSEPKTLKEFITLKGPVFDLFTGLTFVNQSIFQCNKYTESEGVICGSLQFTIDDTALVGKMANDSLSFEDFSADLISGKTEYTFIPDIKRHPELNNCFHAAQRICTPGILDMSVFEDYKDKCEKKTSYVLCSEIVYANSYCMKCSNLFRDIAQCHALTDTSGMRSGGGNALSLLVSFDDNEDNVVLKTGGSLAAKHPWEQISCNVSSGKPCAVVGCPKSTHIMDNNICTRKVYTAIDIYTHYQLDKGVVYSLHDLMVCSFEQTKGLTSVVNTAKPTQVYDVLKHEFHIHAGFMFNSRFHLSFSEKEDSTQKEDIVHVTALYTDIVRIYAWYADLVSNGELLASGPLYGCFCASFEFCTTKCTNQKTYEIRSNNSIYPWAEYNGTCASALSLDMFNGGEIARPLKCAIGFGVIVIFCLAL